MASRAEPSGAEDVEVVIIGAGLSGLTAAYHLQQKGVTNLRVIEERDRVGGRTLSHELRTAHGTEKWDIGGQWVGSSQHYILDLLKELDIETYPQYRDGQRVLFFPNGKLRSYTGAIPPAPLRALLQYKLLLNMIARLCKTVSPEHPEKCRNAEKWDSMTVAGFMREHSFLFGRELMREIFKTAIRSIFSVEPEQLSFLYFLQTCASAGGLVPLATSDLNSGQETKIKGTAHGVSLRLLDKVGVKKVILGDRVTSVSQKQGQSCSVVTSKGLHFNAKFVIVAIPPHLRPRIGFCEPSLPAEYHHLHQQYLPGHYMKIFFTYETPFWRERNFSGEVVGAGKQPTAMNDSPQLSTRKNHPRAHGKYAHLEQDAGVEERSRLVGNPILFTFDASIDDGEKLHPALLAFIQPKAADLRSSIGDEELRSKVLDQLVRFFGHEAASPIDYVIADWFGADTPVINTSPGALMNFGQLRRKPFGRVHWAGAESGTQWIGYMNAAVQAGRRAADEVREKLAESEH